MSDLLRETKLSDSHDCPAFSKQPILQKIPNRVAEIGEGITIRRALPSALRRTIGAWCFFDHFGPVNLKSSDLKIAPHPHMGLQTFTWTLTGEILHRDSLGSEQIIRPGEVNLMSAGHGISHSEESLPDSVLHGVQLWIALPDAVRNNKPEFSHYSELPSLEQDGVQITVLAGEFLENLAPAKVYSPLIGLALHARRNAATRLPLNPAFEYGVLVLTGEIQVEQESLVPGTLLYLGCGREELSLQVASDSHIFIIGGEPFKEEILLWWNFVARSKAEMSEAADAWEKHERFGEVKGYGDGTERLNPPKLA